MSSNQQQPGLVGGHAQYVKGAAEVRCIFFHLFPYTPSATIYLHHEQEMVGQVTGLPTWKSSGQEDKTAAVDAMKKASEGRDPSKGLGGIEEKAGNLVGCEGMQKEGAESKKQ